LLKVEYSTPRESDDQEPDALGALLRAVLVRELFLVVARDFDGVGCRRLVAFGAGVDGALAAVVDPRPTCVASIGSSPSERIASCATAAAGVACAKSADAPCIARSVTSFRVSASAMSGTKFTRNATNGFASSALGVRLLDAAAALAHRRR
jgi:hypothetical protein